MCGARLINVRFCDSFEIPLTHRPRRKTGPCHESPTVSLSLETASIFWMLIAAALVMLMQGGFCFLESGLARAKNSINVAIKNLSDFCISAILFWACGFGLMFGADWCGLTGLSHFGLNDTTSAWLLAFFLFQLVFSSTATTIVSGAVAERMSFVSYLIVSALVSGLIYPVFGHWAWGGIVEGTGSGWLASLGFIDFAGSTVVHSVGGWVALVAAIVVGPRIGRFDGSPRKMHGHNYPMATLGVILLWFGWFGFNGGSTLAVTDAIPKILVNTNLAAAFGGVTGLLLSWGLKKRPEVGDIINGVIAGLVGITAACHMVSPLSAVAIGVVASGVCYAGAVFLEWLKIDDVIGAVPAHAFAGAWGTLAVAIFAAPGTLPEGVAWWQQLGVQALGVGVAFAWAGGVSLVLLQVVRLFTPLRVSEQAEIQGLNISEHGACTEIIDLLDDMREQSRDGEFAKTVAVEPHTEVGQIAAEYNKVLTRVVTEIDQREDLLQQLTAAEAKYRTIFENASEGIFRVDASGKLLEANPSLAAILGYASPRLAMEHLTSFWNQSLAIQDHAEQIRDLIRSGDNVHQFQTEVSQYGGETLHVSINARRYDGTPDQPFVEGSIIDITQQRRAETLRKQMQAAQAASEAKSTFLATMSHEIRTPLNGVIGMLELLQPTGLDTKQMRYIGIARSSADALLGLINDILDFSKIEAGKFELNEAEFNLPVLFEDTADMFAPAAEQKGLELSCQVMPEVAARVLGDADRLRQVLVNLVSNAIKFTESGEVVIRAEVAYESGARQRIRFEVRDTGIGIAPEIQAKLFQVFEQADNSTTRKFGGTGLGLAICRQLVEMMGGEIFIESEVGQGAAFICEIPFEVGRRGAAKFRMDKRLRGIRVLAVDDNSTNRTILNELLTSWGAEIEVAACGEEALQQLNRAAAGGRPFEFVIVDYHMPEMDGLTVARRIRETSQLHDVRVLMLTSSDLNLSQRELRAAGIRSCSLKPVRPSRLFDDLLSVLYHDGNLEQEDKELSETGGETDSGFDADILIVDDNEINQIVTKEIVEELGGRCHVVGNGKEAVRALSTRPFDLVLMDCQMPVMDGFQATGKIRELQGKGELTKCRTNPLPVIALTANAVKGDRERCLNAGMNEHVTKPIDPQKLKDVLTSWLPSDQQPGDVASDDCTPLNSLPLVDFESVLERCCGKPALVEKILRKFSLRVHDDLDALQSAADRGDWAELMRHAHHCKGAAATVSAGEVAGLAATIEACCKAGQTDDAVAGVETLRQRVDATLQFIDEQLETGITHGL